ncbi:MAG: tetratricopeptide repeat protein [Treponema sp.]|nr:tetratricopeptide repeat protein [Treponema sp.]MCL2271906.1 tetratricopeptide repeat protein [Treponema sp.]
MGIKIKYCLVKLLKFSLVTAIFFSCQPHLHAQTRLSLSDEIRSLTETGKLSSMLAAIELIRSRELNNSEFGRVMTGINILLIGFIYPDSPARLPVIDLPQTHSYTRIIREAEKGNYANPSANSSDFFEHILPFLAIKVEDRSNIQTNALRDLAKAGELRPASVLPVYFQGVIHENSGHASLADFYYRKAYSLSDECYPALAGIARISKLQGNTAEAVNILSDLIIRYPDSIDLKRQLALTYFDNNEWSRAQQMVDDILLSDPRDGELLLMKTRIHIEQSQFPQANTVLDTYASINTNNRDYLFYRARVQAEGFRNRDSAINYMRSILRTNENDTEAMMYAARLLMESPRSSDQQEGRELLTRLRRISGSSFEVVNLSLQDAIRRENWEEAQGFLSFILGNRRTPADLINAYYVERGLRNNARALSFARELYELNQANVEYASIYISALIDNGRRDEASRMISSALNSPGSGIVRGRLYYLRSRLQINEEEALSDLRSSIFEDPRNLDAIIAMFDIYHRRREERRAVYYLRQALAIAPDNLYLKRFEAEYGSLLDRN